jgi:hypothetical protein
MSRAAIIEKSLGFCHGVTIRCFTLEVNRCRLVADIKMASHPSSLYKVI